MEVDVIEQGMGITTIQTHDETEERSGEGDIKVDISTLLSGLYGKSNQEWITWKFSEEEEGRRKAYLPKP